MDLIHLNIRDYTQWRQPGIQLYISDRTRFESLLKTYAPELYTKLTSGPEEYVKYMESACCMIGQILEKKGE